MPLSQDEKNRFLELYRDFIQKHDSSFLSKGLEAVYYKLAQSEELFMKLNIQLSLNLIEEIYKETGIIVLRDPSKEDAILVGCGNSPIEPVCDYNTGPDEHTHSNFVTIDPDLTSNPTIAAFFGRGNDALEEVFHRFRPDKKFKVLAFEAANPIADNRAEIRTYNYSFLEPNFKTIEVSGHNETEELLENQTIEVFRELIEQINKAKHVKNDPTDPGNHFFQKPLTLKKLEKIVDNDNLEKFKEYFKDTSSINTSDLLKDYQPLSCRVFESEAWKIFAYLIQSGASLTKTYYGESVEDELLKIINEDDSDKFRKIFRSKELLNTSHPTIEKLVQYINEKKPPNIIQFINNPNNYEPSPY